MSRYNPFDWYWLADDGRVFASARQAIVDKTDAGFIAAEAAIGVTRWPQDDSGKQTSAALQAVLAPYGLFVDPAAYAETKQADLMAGGYAFNIAASGAAPKIVQADTDIRGRTNLNGLVLLAQMDSTFTSVWVQAGGPLTLTSTQIIALGRAVGLFVEQTYQALANVLSEIAAGTITTTGQVDAASWPANHN